jgi:hypothetical protein
MIEIFKVLFGRKGNFKINDDKYVNVKEVTLTIDGKRIKNYNLNSQIKIEVEGNVYILSSTSGDIKVKGNVQTVSSTNGSVEVNGNINGDVKTTVGDIRAKSLSGNAKTTSGDVIIK